ncbi:butyrophilin subfamily 2 member A2-like [Dicentrarchus labrax]|uniref:butyrophilin subfamily 2 member A2-like n=1 Tax=Dicentrarchus labrax TaxID=13489 RepID=UPI0021F65A20|nr:butyrophilin subfamily 2 member A2-like [Dicentrarchus labrax]
MIHLISTQYGVFSAVAVLLLLTDSCGGRVLEGQTQLIGPLQPVVTTVGDDVILPCLLEPGKDAVTMAFEWTRSDLNPRFVHVRHSGQDLLGMLHPSYKGRTSLSSERLKSGDISLKLSEVKPSDEGKYRCYIPGWEKESFVELVVGAVSSHFIVGIDKVGKGVVLQCESNSWYPEPEVVWLDGEGNLLSAGPTETVRGPDDLYTVSSRVTVEKRHSNNFTCRVQQKDINQTRETHIYVQDTLFDSSAATVTGLAVTLAISLSVNLLGFCVWRCRRCK